MDYEAEKREKIDQIVSRLIEQRKKPASERIEALRNLHLTAMNDVQDILIALMQSECNNDVLVYICNSLAKLGNDEAVMPLVDLLLANREIEESNSSDPIKDNKEAYLTSRCAAVKALGRLRNQKAVMPLMYVLNDRAENYKLRLNIAEALGRIGDGYAVNPLISLVADEKEKSIYVRESAAKALGMLGDVRAIKPLVEVLQSKRGIVDKFTFLKERVIEAIGRMPAETDGETIRALKESLSDEAPSVRLSAIEALVAMDDPAMIEYLKPLVFDKEEEDVARESVRAIFDLDGALELKQLLQDDTLPGWSRDEIETIFEEEGM